MSPATMASTIPPQAVVAVSARLWNPAARAAVIRVPASVWVANRVPSPATAAATSPTGVRTAPRTLPSTDTRVLNPPTAVPARLIVPPRDERDRGFLALEARHPNVTVSLNLARYGHGPGDPAAL